MPPTAAIAGNTALARVDNSPASISRLISIPTSRKKTAIKPSLMMCSTDSVKTPDPMAKPIGMASASSRHSRKPGVLATKIASKAAAKRATPPAVSAFRK